MSFYSWGRKPTVAAQRKKAEKLIAKKGKGGNLSPVFIEGNKIVSSFWGKSWCRNLERYSDYANRLPRGRSYVRNRCVIDLQIGSGEIKAQVSGSSLYKITISVAPLDEKVWRAICRDCAGSIASMVELLQGRLSEAVMDRVCRDGDGLFPTPKGIKLACSCPDGAYMCKHVAATLYGIGARLDSKPELLFMLRGVDPQQLILQASESPATTAVAVAANSTKLLADVDLASLFGVDIDQSTCTAESVPCSRNQSEAKLPEVGGLAKAKVRKASAGKKSLHSDRGSKRTTGKKALSAKAQLKSSARVRGPKRPAAPAN